MITVKFSPSPPARRKSATFITLHFSSVCQLYTEHKVATLVEISTCKKDPVCWKISCKYIPCVTLSVGKFPVSIYYVSENSVVGKILL